MAARGAKGGRGGPGGFPGFSSPAAPEGMDRSANPEAGDPFPRQSLHGPWTAPPVSGSGYEVSPHVGNSGRMENPFPGTSPIFGKLPPGPLPHPAANST